MKKIYYSSKGTGYMGKLIWIALFILFYSIVSYSNAQTFTRNISPTYDLTGSAGSCATPGTENTDWFKVTVSGVGILNTTSNALTKISFTLDNTCTGSSANTRLLQVRVMAPDGTCVGVYYGDNASGNDATISLQGTQVINLITPQTCTNYPNDANMGTSSNSSNEGVYGAKWGNGTTDTPTDLTSTFNGKNANGDWKIIFSEGTVSEPCLKNLSLTFGDPTLLQPTDRTADGNTCATAIALCQKAICASTNGKTGEINSPGANQGQDEQTISTFANGSCDWNARNNNDVWIKFKAATTSMTISLSGLDQQLQSIVVTNPSGDGSACPAIGESWNVVSCPRNAIYSGTTGTTRHHTHTFPTIIGNVYYLVVDGEGAAESPFYVQIPDGSTCTTLPIILEKIEGYNLCHENFIYWTTASERNNDYFIIEETIDGENFHEIGRIDGSGNSSEEKQYSFSTPITNFQNQYYYRLSQVDYNGNREYFDVISIQNDCQKKQVFLVNNQLKLIGIDHVSAIYVYDMLGKLIAIGNSPDDINFTNFSTAFYTIAIQTPTETILEKLYKP